MVNRLFTILILFLLAGFTSLELTAATISVKTDRTQVSINESFQLIFEVDGDIDDDPNFSPLEQELQILSTVQSSNFSVLNGRITSSKRWTLTAMANAPGELTIPAIAFGRDKSPQIKVDVKDINNSGNPGQVQDDIYLEAFASPLNPYVQSQVVYTIKLYRSVAIAKASLADPEITSGNAVLERLDDDKSYETTISGKNYQVIERNYAVYPQSSGEVTIAPINFMGQISRSRFGLDPFGAPPRTVVRRSQAVKINVRSIPDSFTGDHWLPAENLNIAEEWSADPLTMRVGEPITRTLVLTAKGLISSQLPELPVWNLSDLKFYPDRPQLDDEKSDKGITSSRREKAAIIPNQPGSYLLPEVSVPWWNTQTNRLEYALVPERTIEVLPATGMPENLASISGLVQTLPQVTRPPEQENNAVLADPALPISETTNIWKWTTLLLALVWLVTLLVWRQNNGRKNKHAKPDEKTQRKEKLNNLIKEVVSACQANDPLKTKNALVRWGNSIWPENLPLGIAEIARHASPVLASELHKLNQVLYSHSPEPWQGSDLQKVFSEEAKNITSSKTPRQPGEQGKLEPLFKLS